MRGTLRNFRWSRKVRWQASHRFPLAMLTGQLPAKAQHRVTETNRKRYEQEQKEEERQRRIETGEVLPDEDAEEERRAQMESLRAGSNTEGVGRGRGGDAENDEHVPVVLQRTRDLRRKAPRGAGVGLYLDVPTVRWAETTEGGVSESVGTNILLAADGGKGMLRVDGGGVSVTGGGDPTRGTR